MAKLLPVLLEGMTILCSLCFSGTLMDALPWASNSQCSTVNLHLGISNLPLDAWRSCSQRVTFSRRRSSTVSPHSSGRITYKLESSTKAWMPSENSFQEIGLVSTALWLCLLYTRMRPPLIRPQRVGPSPEPWPGPCHGAGFIWPLALLAVPNCVTM